MRKHWCTITLLLLIGSLAMAQSKNVGDYSALGVQTGKSGGSITMALQSNPVSFFYYSAIDQPMQTIYQLAFDGLIEYNLRTYAIEPALAESWTLTNGGTVYTFKLRRGVKWHDGTEFTADDVIFTFNQVIFNPEARAGNVVTPTYGGKPVVFTKVDKYTVRATLAVPAPGFLTQMRTFILPKHKLLRWSVEGGATRAEINNAWPTSTDPKDVVGTGAFKLSSYTPSQRVVLTKNTDYWKKDSAGNDLPYLDQITFLIVSDPQAQVAQLLAGNLGYINASGAQFPDLKQREVSGAPIRVLRSLQLFGGPNSTRYIFFNFDAKDKDLAELFRLSDFRRAIQFAVNRERVVDAAYNGLAQTPGHGMFTGSTWYFNTVNQLGRFDLQAAGALLERIGVRGSSAGRTWKGKPLEFTLTYASDQSDYPAIAAILQNDLRQIGIKVNFQTVPFSQLLSTGTSGNFEVILGQFGDQPDPELRRPIWQPANTLYYWHQTTVKDGKPVFENFLPWEREIYNLWEQAGTTSSQTQRKALYDRWQSIIAREVMMIPLVKPESVAAHSNRYGNVLYNPMLIPGFNPVPLLFQR
ncbi:MAG: ABC transporter substrate-binding protein [Meiothermus sp.]|nr:ABC transporter substrate-binding protein [Meiothermus sp.]